ncbi:LCP family protein [Tumebacillus sp. DT12]|uniref:LCP family protein n=1 Tax=Tumebacillus lacus TaxID=2995335 RepID=A0ABT3X549_9BACL|nr:LCP family protein [Tumebacillus lacus]MCX7570967.1 LCP family protein [Tumebacillus lacus]
MQSRRDRTRPGSGQKKKFWQSRKFRWGLGIFLVLLLVIGLVYAYYINNFLNQIQVPKNPDQREVKEVEKWSGTDPVNIVLFGVDNRDNDKNPRSDSILIASIDPVTKKAKVMSVMRDTWVQIPEGYGKEKINAAFALGGPDLAIKTLKEFLQIPIHYYVKTDFQGFIGIVDALGGVEIDVEKPLHYNDDGVYDINLKQGLQRLDGQHALMYVRFRYDAMADFARTERQRKFLEAVANEISSPATLLKVPKLLEAIGPYIETNISKSDMVKLGMLAREVDSSALESMQVPPMETLREGTAGGGQSVLIPNIYETQVKVYEFLGLDPSKLDKTPNNQPSEYYQPEPVVPDNPKIEPDTPTPTVPETKEPTPGTGTGGTKTPGTGTGTTPGTGGGTTTPGTGGGTTTPGTGGRDKHFQVGHGQAWDARSRGGQFCVGVDAGAADGDVARRHCWRRAVGVDSEHL